jgi:hypothetical protein
MQFRSIMESDAQFHVECIKTNFVCPSRSESSTSLVGGDGEDKHFCDWHVPEQLCDVLKEESFRNLERRFSYCTFLCYKSNIF